MQEIAEDEPAPKWIIVAAEPITDVDTTAADMLHDLDEWLNARGINLVIAEMKDPVRRKIDRYELTRTIDPAHFFPTIGAATKAFRDETGAEWRTPPTQPALPDTRGGHRKERPGQPSYVLGGSRLGRRGGRPTAGVRSYRQAAWTYQRSPSAV